MRVDSAARQLGIALALLGPGCIYTFDNPVQTQNAGTVTGQLQLGTSVAGQSLAGAQVDLLWSNLSVTLGTTGDFGFLSLPDGTYTLRYSVGPAAAPLAVGELRDIYLPPIPGGGVDTLDIGAITVNTAGTVQGTVVGLDGGAVVAAFAPDPPDGGVGEFEGFSTTTGDGGAYTLILPPGPHELWASTPTRSASLQISLNAGQLLTGQDFVGLPQSPAPTGGAMLAGYAVLGDFGASGTVAQVTPLANGLGVTLTPAACAGCGLEVSFQTPDPPAGISATELFQTLQPGLLYDVEVSPPTDTSPPSPPVFLHGIPAIAGRTTFLRQIFVFSQRTVDANAAAADAGGGSGSPDGGTGGGGGSDGGPAQWTPLATVAAPNANVVEVSLLPYEGGHLVAFIDTTPTLWTSDDVDGGFTAAASLVTSDLSPAALAGASFVNKGQPLESLGFWNSTETEFFLITNSGAWAFPTPYADATPFASQSLALAPDPTNELWAASCSDGGLELQTWNGTSQTVARTFDGGLPMAVAATACPQGVCLAWEDNANNGWVGVLDVDAGTVSGQEVVYGASVSATGTATPSISSLPSGAVAAAWPLPTPNGTDVSYAQMTSPTTPPATVQHLAPSGMVAPPVVLPWRGGFLLLGGGSQLQATAIGAGLAAPAFPSGVTPVSQPSGYVDAKGNLVVAVNTGGGVAIYTLPP